MPKRRALFIMTVCYTCRGEAVRMVSMRPTAFFDHLLDLRNTTDGSSNIHR